MKKKRKKEKNRKEVYGKICTLKLYQAWGKFQSFNLNLPKMNEY